MKKAIIVVLASLTAIPAFAWTWSGVEEYTGISHETAVSWENAGFTPQDAEKWIEYGLNTPAKEIWLSKMCKASVGSPTDLSKANPYDVNDKCFLVRGTSIQVLSKTTALVSSGRATYLVNFGVRPAPRGFFKGVAIGIGSFDYVTVAGDKQIIPSLKMVWVNSNSKAGDYDYQ